MENVFEHDAIPTWSGFIYQGRIAVYLAIKKIIELRDGNKISEIDKYAIEMEKCEDIAIVYKGENEKREYISIVDLLRYEFEDRQIFISTHEQTFEWFLRYRYSKANKAVKIFNMKEIMLNEE